MIQNVALGSFENMEVNFYKKLSDQELWYLDEDPLFGPFKVCA